MATDEAGRVGLRSFDQAVAVVTGGASGIGAALGRALARSGATVVLADRQGDEARREADLIRAGGGRAEAVEIDVRDAAAVASLADDVILRHGRIDYFFNNAGIAIQGEVRDLSLEDWRDTVEVNLMGIIHGVRAVYHHMLEQRFGHIVNTASMAGLSSSAFNTPYCATKHAVVGLSRSLRIEAVHYNVRVSAVCPGVIRTPILEGGRFGRFPSRVPRETQRALWEQLRPMDPDVFAARVLREIRRNRAIIIFPWFWRLLYWFERLSPTLTDALAVRGTRRLKAIYDEAARRDGPST